MSTLIESLLNSWSSNRNVLIYGPPGTGKTRMISELFDMLQEPPEASSGILMNPLDAAAPFSRPSIDIPIPQPVNVVWATFHQSFGYDWDAPRNQPRRDAPRASCGPLSRRCSRTR